MPNNPLFSELGPWAGADLEGTAATYSGVGTDDDIDPVMRLGRNVGLLALRRIRQHLGAMRRDAIAVFLLQPTAPPDASTAREPMLGDGGIEVCGKIWFTNVTAQSGRSLAVDCEDDGAIFDQVETLGLGHVPAVVFNPKVVTPTIRVYGRGLGAENDFESIEVIDRDVSLTDIRRIIDLMHEKNLCTPDAHVTTVSMWADSTRFHAANNAEAIAQLQVKTALSLTLFNCDIRQEQRMRAGRVDLEVVQQLADGAIVIPAEIEIKVLRERNQSGRKLSDARVERWMRSGVRQAAAYRIDRGAKAGMLCCFDMRRSDRGDTATFANVKLYAESLDVVLHRNFLYNDAESYRVAKYGN